MYGNIQVPTESTSIFLCFCFILTALTQKSMLAVGEAVACIMLSVQRTNALKVL